MDYTYGLKNSNTNTKQKETKKTKKDDIYSYGLKRSAQPVQEAKPVQPSVNLRFLNDERVNPLLPKLPTTQQTGPQISLDENSYVTQNFNYSDPVVGGTKNAIEALPFGVQKGVINMNRIPAPEELLLKLIPGASDKYNSLQNKLLGNELTTAIQQREQNVNAYQPKGIGGQIGYTVGKEAVMAPLWMAGEGALSLGASKVLPALGKVGQIATKLPGQVKGAALDAASYGTVVAPTETYLEGGDINTLIEKEKQLPFVFGGGLALRSAGQAVGNAYKNGLSELDDALNINMPKVDASNVKILPTAEELRRQDIIASGLGVDNPAVRVGANPSPAEYFQNVANQADLERVFGGPIKNYKFTTGRQRFYDDLFNGRPQAQNVTDYFGNVSQADLENLWGTPLRRYTFKPRNQVEYENLFSGDDAFFFAQREAAKANATPDMYFGNRTQDQLDPLASQLPRSLKQNKTYSNLPKDIEELKKEISYLTSDENLRKIALDMQSTENSMYQDNDSIIRQVIARGGIKLNPNSDIREEYLIDIPLRAKNKNGLPLDEMADELGMTANELIAELKNTANRTFSNRTFRDYMGDAYNYVTSDQSYLDMLDALDAYESALKKPRTLNKNVTLAGPVKREANTITKEVPANTQAIDVNNVNLSPRDLSRTREGKAYPFELRPREIAQDSRANVNLTKNVMQGEQFIPRTSDGVLPDIRITEEGIIPNDSIRKINNDPVSLLNTNPPIPPANPPSPPVDLPEPINKVVIGKENNEKFSFKKAWDNFYRRIVDTQNEVMKLEKITGTDIGKKASNTRSANGTVEYILRENLVDRQGNRIGDSFEEVLKGIPKGEEKDFWTFMLHQHNIDRASTKIKILPNGKPRITESTPIFMMEETVDGVTKEIPYTSEMSQQMVDKILKNKPNYAEASGRITKWIDDFMKEWGVNSGLTDETLYKELREMYANYIPTQREFSTLERSSFGDVSSRFVDQTNPVKKAKGYSSRDITNPVENIMNLVNRTVKSAKYNEVGQDLIKAIRQNPAMKELAEIVPEESAKKMTAGNVVTVLENGKKVYVRFNNKELLDTFNGMPQIINNAKAMRAVTNMFKGLITQKNPFYAVRNVFRDIPTAYIYGSEANPFKFTYDLAKAGKDIITNSENFQRYRAVGGGMSNFFVGGDETWRAAKELTNPGFTDGLLQALEGKGTAGKLTSKALGVVVHPVRTIETFNNILETAPRMAEFNRILDKTGDVTKALYGANDITVNYARGGDVVKKAEPFIPYLNAGVQGLDKFFRQFSTPEKAVQTLVKGGIAITAPQVALYLINKDDPAYQALDNRTKDIYYLIPTGDGQFIKIPKSRELGVLFGSLFERAMRKANGESEAFKGFGKTAATNFSPANPIENNFFSPIYNIKSNKDFAGRSIVPQGMKLDGRPEYLQYDEKTSNIAKAIGEFSREIGYNDGEGLSPKVIDYLIKSYTGVVGQFSLPATTPGGDPLKVALNPFRADFAFSNQATTDFYDNLDKASAKATEKNIKENIPSNTVTTEESIKNSLNGINESISKANKKILQIQAGNDPDKDAQIRQIKLQILEIIQEANSNKDNMRQLDLVERKAKLWIAKMK